MLKYRRVCYICRKPVPYASECPYCKKSIFTAVIIYVDDSKNNRVDDLESSKINRISRLKSFLHNIFKSRGV